MTRAADTAPARRVAVIGGGVAGLAAAHRVLELRPDAHVTVLEGAPRVGGLVRTERTDDGYVIEHGPDSILTEKPAALALARRLGIDAQIVSTRSEASGAYVVARGRLERIPVGFSMMAPLDAAAFARSPIVSWAGKLRAAAEIGIPRRRRSGARDDDDDDESLGSFVRRRFGQEVLDRLAQPLVGGIYGADPETLSLRATMPRFLDAEAAAGSVTRGLLAARARHASSAADAEGARYSLFANFRRGTQTLVDALEARLGERIRRSSPAVAVERGEGGRGVRVRVAHGDVLEADALIVAVPAPAASELLSALAPSAAGLLREIEYGSSAAVVLAYDRASVTHPLDAYGFVVPTIEGRAALASTWMTSKWPHRAPEGKVLLRVFLGGAGRPDPTAHSDDELTRTARVELAELIGLAAEPELVRVTRYARAMPQFRVGHLSLVRRIEGAVAAVGGLALAGNAYRGVGLPDAIASGERAAERVLPSPLGSPGPKLD